MDNREFVDEAFGQARTELSLRIINKELGDEYREVITTIKTLEVSIAEGEDKGFPCYKQKELLSKYLDKKNCFEKLADAGSIKRSHSQLNEYELTNTVKAWGLVFCVLFVIISVAVACSVH